jgi:beta-glucanase (GH16 family)
MEGSDNLQSNCRAGSSGPFRRATTGIIMRAKLSCYVLFLLCLVVTLSLVVYAVKWLWEYEHTAATKACAASQSGQAMPVDDIPGWHLVFADDFNGTKLNTSNWYPYSGGPGNDPAGWWDKSHVIVGGCVLTLRGYKGTGDKSGVFVTGGIGMTNAHAQTYGKYLVRIRAEKGDGISVIALLWPQANVWPPEVDFYEDGGGDRTHMSATLHCGLNGNDTCQVQRSLSDYDFSHWHTLGVEWTSGKLVYTIDGLIWATVTDSRVPSQPMVLDVQTQALACSPYNTCVDSSTPTEVDVLVAWVVAYAPSSTAQTQKNTPITSAW